MTYAVRRCFAATDLGYADVSYHGTHVNASVPTPTVDELSGEGVRLENYYVTQLCSPTRSSLMSGRYPYTIGMNAEVIVDGHPSCMPTNVSTIADRLNPKGWATAAYGKWDLGMVRFAFSISNLLIHLNSHRLRGAALQPAAVSTTFLAFTTHTMTTLHTTAWADSTCAMIRPQ